MRPMLHDFVPLAYVILTYRISFSIMTVLSRLDLWLGLHLFCTLYSNVMSRIVVQIPGNIRATFNCYKV